MIYLSCEKGEYLIHLESPTAILEALPKEIGVDTNVFRSRAVPTSSGYVIFNFRLLNCQLPEEYTFSTTLGHVPLSLVPRPGGAQEDG